jgi:hypothetical protein
LLRNRRYYLQLIGKTVGLQINCEKTQSLRITVECDKNFRIRGEDVEEVEKFIYPGSGITRDDGTETDVRTRVQTANSAFTQLHKFLWKA